MKLHAIGMAALVALAAGTAHARDGSVGGGIILAEPTGVTGKVWLDRQHAVDVAAAWSFAERDSLQFHADYLYHRFDLIHEPRLRGELPVYFGVGGRLLINDDDRRRDDDDRLGLRLPVGVTYLFGTAPFDLFAEVVPVLDVTPSTDFDLTAAIGGRYYFGGRMGEVRAAESEVQRAEAE